MTTSVKNRVSSSWLDLNRLILIPLSNYNLSESNSTVTKTPSSLAQATAIYSASKSRITWLHGISTEKKRETHAVDSRYEKKYHINLIGKKKRLGVKLNPNIILSFSFVFV